MSRPEWGGAPEWAQWLAQDENGDWFWYEDAPKQELGLNNCWGNWRGSGRSIQAIPSTIDWRETLERRP